MKEGQKMKNALSILPRFRQKHPIVTNLIVGLILILAGVVATLVIQKFAKANFADYSYYPELDFTEVNGVAVYSTATGNDIYGEYVITSTTKGVICVGNAFITQGLAYRYPLVLSLDESYGEVSVKVFYTGTDDEGTYYTYSSGDIPLELGKSGIYTTKVWLHKGYIYVIVKDKNEIER